MSRGRGAMCWLPLLVALARLDLFRSVVTRWLTQRLSASRGSFRPPKNFAARAASGRGFSTPRAHEGIRRAVAGAALRPFTPGRTGQHAAEENSDRMA